MSKRPADGEDGGPAAKQPRLLGNGSAVTIPQGPDASMQPEAPNAPRVYYKDGKPLRELAANFRQGVQVVEVTIPPESMTANNKQVKARQLWGDRIYTDDSDVVAVLMHLGYYGMHNPSQTAAVLSFHALLRLLPPRDQYASCFRNAVRSRAWFAKVDGCSYQVEKCWLTTRAQRQAVDLTPCADEGDATIPTFAPSSADRQISTRSSGAAGRPKAVSEVTVLYSLANEPWLKYSMAAVADRGLRPSAWTSARLARGGEVLYMETNRERFELSYSGAAGEGAQLRDTFTLARCKQALPLAAMRREGIPCPPSAVEVLEAGLSWDELQWGSVSLQLRGRELKVVRLQFLERGAAAADGEAAK